MPGQPGALPAHTVLMISDARLARYKIPKAVVFTDILPRNAMGKVVKADLYARFVQAGES